MKVAILSANYLPLLGGAEVFVQKLGLYLLKQGHDVDIITLKNREDLSNFEIIDGINVYRASYSKIRGISFFSAIVSLYRVLSKLDKEKNYDIVHSVGEAPTCQSGALFKRLKNKPHLITIQGGYIARREYLNAIKKREFIDETVLKEIGKNRFGDSILEILIKGAFKNTDALHAISNVIAKESQQLGAKNIKVIPNGVDEDMININLKEKKRLELGIPIDKKIIISLSRLTPRKGFRYVITAYSKIIERYPNSILIIIGDGCKKRELQNLTKELGIESHVEFKGFIPHNKIIEILPIADVFALTPIYEGLGIVYIESLACEVPVVSTPVGGIPDIIQNGYNGILVPFGDVEKLGSAISHLLSDDNMHTKYQKNGVKTVKKKFLWNNIFSEIEKIYSEIM